MTTLKIVWKEKEDMRRVQLAAVHQALTSLDGRSFVNTNDLRFRDLRDYAFLVFPELQTAELLLYYIDDDNEQVRITNDAELDEAFRLMRELAIVAGKEAKNAVCKILVVSRPLANVVATPLPPPSDTMLASQQKKKILGLFVDLGKIVGNWEATAEYQTLKKDLLSLLHEPGCQEAMMEIMANPRFATLFTTVTEEVQKHTTFVECFAAVAGTDDLETVAKILLAKCPYARVQVERVLQQVQDRHNAQLMSTSDYFENISMDETKQDLGPVLAVFEGDVTCPDGTVVLPGEAFDKVWKLRNGGSNKWPIGAMLSCVGGDKMHAPDSVLIPSVLPGKSIDVSLRMVAPMKAGRYTGYWRLSTPDGNRFGQRLWVDINVMEPEEPFVSVVESKEVPIEAPKIVMEEEKRADSVQTNGDDTPWAVLHQVLADMGFMDHARNEALLTQYNGDLDAVISGLLSSC
ncbi:hypothetical protein CCR75_001357 [Bremia lactucae]|uniref:PB1 domain-containing protein n=1 Tax=Bremia lactucae TaxID=4779 RepID=A0A976FFC4_BRELC|nr:hypothetical protein CCR75_001357 [Bremia lactucae]